jgi:simple sugar transport system ATP-binding protein
MSVEENVSLGRQAHPPFAKGAWIDFDGRRARAQALVKDFDVRPPEPKARITALSGGNQQKVVVARELSFDPKLVVVVQPTRGLDIAAVAQVQERLRRACQAGAGILLVSLDLEELLALADRLYVFYDGRVTGALPRSEYDERRIGQLMLSSAASPTPATAEVAHG